MSMLSNWSEAIERSGESSRQAQINKVDLMKRDFDVIVPHVMTFDDERLLEYFAEIKPRTYPGWMDYGEAAVWAKMEKVVKQELLKRMEK